MLYVAEKKEYLTLYYVQAMLLHFIHHLRPTEKDENLYKMFYVDLYIYKICQKETMHQYTFFTNICKEVLTIG